MQSLYLIAIFSLLALNISLCGGIAVMSIDLGSEWMKIAIVKPGVPMEIVLNKESKRKTEVAVSLRGGERVFGSSAVNKGVRFPKTTYVYFQDLLAKKLDHPLVKQYQRRFPYYDLKEDPVTGTVLFVHDAEKEIYYSPEELMAMVLNHSRSLAEDYAQQPIDTCVITVPPHYDQAERRALLYSANLAGLKLSQLMDDNTAAALNYGVFRRSDINASASYLLMYDMGASSTVATVISYQVVKVNGIADPQLSVKGVGFDRSLGGLEMELRLRDHLIKLFDQNKKTKMDVKGSPRAMAKLLKEARRLKKVLSANVDHMAQIEGLIDDEDFRAKVSREDFETICSDLLERAAQPMLDAIKSSELTLDLMSQILLVGGGTRVPKVQEILLKVSGKSDLGKSINADEAAALGASYQAAALSNAFRVKTFHVKAGTVFPIEIDFDRSVVSADGEVAIKHVKRTLFQRNNPYPQRKVITFNRFYDNFNFSVNYGDLSFLPDTARLYFDSNNISHVQLDGVAKAHDKHVDDNETESKGVKAHFRMDESGVLNLESVEAVFEGNKTVMANASEATSTDEESTLQKIKEGFSNLFGGGSDESNDTKAEEKDKEEGKEEKAKTEKTAEKTEAKKEAKPEVKKSNETGQLEKKIVKVKHSENITIDVMSLDHVTPTSERDESSRKKLKELDDVDAFKFAREVAMNKLETFIYDKRDKLYQSEYEEAMTQEENKKISEALDSASEWMDDLEGEPAAEVYNERLKELKNLARPWLIRVKQRQDVVPLMQDLENMFNHSIYFLRAVMALSDDMQIYTPVEIKTLAELINTTMQWKNTTMKQELQLKSYQDPILKPEDVRNKVIDLNREVQYMINKAKTAKPKKPKEEKKNQTSSATDEKVASNTTSSEEEPVKSTTEDTTSSTPDVTEEPRGEAPPTSDESPTEDTVKSETTEEPTKEAEEVEDKDQEKKEEL